MFSLIQWFVVMTLVVGLFSLGYGLARRGSRTNWLPTPSSGPSIPAQSPPLSPATMESATVTSEETVSLPIPLLEETLVPATPLPVPTWQSSVVPSDAELEAMVAEMSLQDKIGQMIIVGFHGQSVATSPELAAMIGDYHIGGVVLLEANAHDPQQLSALTAELQSLATSSGASIPLFIAINHEGGIVVRITEGVTGFPGNMAVAATGRVEPAYVSAALAARELRAMGVNMNLAPVLDVNDNPMNPVIGVRSFGDVPSLVANYGRLAIRGNQDNGIIAIAKHFPGHGSVAVDSHGGLPVLEASIDELMNRELVPFASAIEQGVAGIMTAHVAVPALDDSNRPATFSPQILAGLLRQQMGYNGLIVTDSLGMGGASASRGQAQAALEAVQAGADIVLSTTPMEAHIAIIQAMMAAVQKDQIPVQQIDRSVLRILRVKYAFGLFESQAASAIGEVGSSEYQAIADEIARQAVTLLRNDEGTIPLPSSDARLLLISPDHLPPAVSGDGTLFAELLCARGHEVTEFVFNLDSGESREYVYASATAQAPWHDIVIFGEWELIKRNVNWGDQWQEDLIQELGQAGPPLIVVAWHNPAAILRCPRVSSFLTAYGNTRAQVTAVVGVLVGESASIGVLPMTIP
jgi:beta-N-acetylhexosaminidase